MTRDQDELFAKEVGILEGMGLLKVDRWPLERRYRRLHELGCLACRKRGFHSEAQIHHQNLGGRAGQKRVGNRATIPLCAWHHQSIPWEGRTRTEMEQILGPSLALSSRAFRDEFGSDESMLAEADALIGEVERAARGRP